MKKSIYILLATFLILLGFKNVHAEEYVLIRLSTYGNGQVAIAAEEEEIIFNDEKPIQSAGQNCEIGKKIKISAKANDGYKFIKWTRNNEDFSIEETLIIQAEEEMELVAQFEPIISDNILSEEDKENNIILYMIIGVGALLGIILLIALFTKKKNR